MTARTEQEAISHKQQIGIAAKTWHGPAHFSNGAAAVTFLNTPTAQQAGEALITNSPGGGVDLYYFL
jgi:hypothetical protein